MSREFLVLQLQSGDSLIEIPIEGLAKEEFMDWFKKLCSISYPNSKKSYYIKELGVRITPQEIKKEKLLTWEEWKKKKGVVKIAGSPIKNDLPFYGEGKIIM